MTPVYVLRCSFCGEESELWRHSYSAIDKALEEWECPKCGCKGYEKVPARTAWRFGDALRSK